MSRDLIVTPEADAQIQRVDTWWHENRGAAPELFREELADAFVAIQTLPQMGRPVRHPRIKGVRRVLLRATRYHAYYVVHGSVVFVLAVWSAVRGSNPPLPTQPG